METTVATEPQFSGWQLLLLGLALLGLVITAIVLVSGQGALLALDATTTTTVTGPNGTTETVTSATSSSPFAVQVAKVLSAVGIAAIAAGAWLQAASMRVAAADAGEIASLGVTTGLPAAMTALGNAMAKMKAPVALVFAGAVMLLMAGFIAVEMVPAREGSALSNLAGTDAGEGDPTTGTTASPSEGAAPTSGPSASPSEPGGPAPTATPTGSPSAPAGGDT